MATQELIEVIATFVDGVSKPIQIMNKSVEKVNKVYERVTTTTGRLNEKTGEYGDVITKVQQRQRRFQMQWLSILFFGMAMNRMFHGLIKTSLEWVGITELMSETMGIIFLPVAEELLNILLPILEWFIEMPDSTKKLIGWIAVFGMVLGGVLSAVGQLALGLAGISWLTAGSSAGSTFLTGLKGKLGGINWGSFLKLAGATISIGLLLDDISKNNFIGSLGDLGMLVGTLGFGSKALGKVAPWLIVGGFVLKLLSEDEFMASIIAFFIKVADQIIALGEKIGKIFWRVITGKKQKDVWDLGGEIYSQLEGYTFKSEFLQSAARTPNPIGSTNITYNITGVSSPSDIKKMLEENNRTITSEINRSVKL